MKTLLSIFCAFAASVCAQTQLTINNITKQLQGPSSTIVVGNGQSITATGTGVIVATSGTPPSLTSTYVGYGDGSNVLTGEAAFTYTAATNTLGADVFAAGAGSAAAPGWTFGGDTDTGVYRQAANTIGVANNGLLNFRFGTLGILRGGTVDNYLQLAADGSIGLVAAGSDQSVTLTPSGTGRIVMGGPVTPGAGPSTTGQSIYTDGTLGLVVQGKTGGVYDLFLANNSGARYMGGLTGSNTVAFAGNLLLGGLTTDDGVNTLQVLKAGIATTPTSAVTIINNTAATGGVPVQMSGQLSLQGTAWNTAASQTVRFFVENLPTSAATPTGTLKFGYSLNGGAASYPMTLTSDGFITTTYVEAVGYVNSPTLYAGGATNGTMLTSTTTGVLVVRRGNADIGVALDVATDATLKVRNRANSADAAITAAAGTFSGVLKNGSRESLQVTSTATAAGTTTLTTASTGFQIFTGATTQNVTLPAANLDGAGFGTMFVIKNRSSGTVTINRAGADLIDGATSYALLTGTSIMLISDGVSEWTLN